MLAQYTETLSEYIDNGGELFEEKFALFPVIEIGDTEFNIKDLFIERYDLREIGAETEQLFAHYLNETLSDIIIEYVPKIEMFVANFNKLMDRKVTLSKSLTRQTGELGDNKYYLNPVNADSTGKLQNFDTYGSNVTEGVTETNDVAYSWFKTNPEILKQVMELKNIYITALDSFEKLFLGVF